MDDWKYGKVVPLLDWPNRRTVFGDVMWVIVKDMYGEEFLEMEQDWWENPPISNDDLEKLAPSLQEKIIDFMINYSPPQYLLNILDLEQHELAREIAESLPKDEKLMIALAMNALVQN